MCFQLCKLSYFCWHYLSFFGFLSEAHARVSEAWITTNSVLTVLKYSMPVSLKLLEISRVVITAATGWPFPMDFPATGHHWIPLGSWKTGRRKGKQKFAFWLDLKLGFFGQNVCFLKGFGSYLTLVWMKLQSNVDLFVLPNYVIN